MNHEEYTQAVEADDWPGDPLVPLPKAFVNDAGEIQNILIKTGGTLTRIRSNRHSVRANHVHKRDLHWSFVESGAVLYFERCPGSKNIPSPRLFTKGQCFFTPPNVEHAMYFPEETVFYTVSRLPRDHKSHESDVVRVAFVTPELGREEYAKWLARTLTLNGDQ